MALGNSARNRRRKSRRFDSHSNPNRHHVLRFEQLEGRNLLAGDMIVGAGDFPVSGNITVFVDGGNLRVVQTGTNTNVVAPQSLVDVDALIITGRAGSSDTLTINLATAINVPITFDGGTGGVDSLIVTGGSFSSGTVSHASPHGGQVILGGTSITFSGLEPVDIAGTAIANLVLNLPNTANDAVLEDDGVGGNGDLRLRSTNGTFETTVFANPAGSLTINPGSSTDTLVIDPEIEQVIATYDVTDQWSSSANPNGAWRYQHGTTLLPQASSWEPSGFSTPQVAWARAGTGNTRLPSIFKSNGTENFTHDWVAGDVVVHTTDPFNGLGSGLANIAWVSPFAGIIDIAGAVWAGREIGRSTHWRLYKNSSLISSGIVSSGDSYSSSNPFRFDLGSGGAGAIDNLSVSTNDVVRLELERNSSAGDFVGVDLTVTRVGDVVNDLSTSLILGSTVNRFNEIQFESDLNFNGQHDITVFADALESNVAITNARNVQITASQVHVGGPVSASGAITIAAESFENSDEITADGEFRITSADLNLGALIKSINSDLRIDTPAGVAIQLGPMTDSLPNTLELSDAEFQYLDNKVILGSQLNTGITTTSAIDFGVLDDFALLSGGDIVINDNFSGPYVYFAPGEGHQVEFNALTVATRGRFAQGTELRFAINGTTPTTDYNQIDFLGELDLTGVELVLSGSYVPQVGDEFQIVWHSGSVIGHFVGLPNGNLIENFRGSGLTAQINYDAIGNFVTIRVLPTSATYVVDIVADEFDGNFSAGDLSLREALHLANNHPGFDFITFSPAVFSTPRTMNLLQGELMIEEGVSIAGPGQYLLTIDANQNSRIFNTADIKDPIFLSGLTLQNGKTTGNNVSGSSDSTYSGGALRSASTGLLKLTDMTITASSTQGTNADGGGVFAAGDVILSVSTISDNTAAGNEAGGGGIYSRKGITLIDSTVSGNRLTGSMGYYGQVEEDDYGAAADGGGGLRAWGDVVVFDSSIVGNQTYGKQQDGGGIWTRGQLMLMGSTVAGNKTHGLRSDGGGIFVQDDDYGGYGDGGYDVLIEMSEVLFNETHGNEASGGGLFFGDTNDAMSLSGLSDMTIHSSMFRNNVTFGEDSDGGAILSEGDLSLTNSRIFLNRTEGKSAGGGGISVRSATAIHAAKVSITTSTISSNAVDDGSGSGIRLKNVDAKITDSTISGNETISDYDYDQATGGGGGIFLNATSYLSLINVTISDNKANARGGGIYSAGELNVHNSTITNNQAYYDPQKPNGTGVGGGIAIRKAPENPEPVVLRLENSIVAGNAAVDSPDLWFDGAISSTLSYSLIGDSADTPFTEAQTPDLNGNLIGNSAGSGVINPGLGILADNGGSTLTHALVAHSPALNRGDPAFASPPDHDQRGEGFERVANGRIDMGAFETSTMGNLTATVAAVLGIPLEEMEDLDAGLLVWLDGNDASSFVPGVTTRWFDKSGNNSSAVQTSTTGAPVQSGAWIDFTPDTDGAGSDLNDTLALRFNYAPAGSWTTTLAFEVDGNSSDQGIIRPGSFSQPGPAVTHHFNLVYAYWGDGGRNLSTTALVGDPHAVVQAWSGDTTASDKLLWVNGGHVTTGGGVPIANDNLGPPLTLGNATTPLNGRIGTVIIHSGVLSTAARQQLEGYLAAVWGTSLPAGHPYGEQPATGDFDDDGDVDGRDFLLWQRNPSIGSLSVWQEEYDGLPVSAMTNTASDSYVDALTDSAVSVESLDAAWYFVELPTALRGNSIDAETAKPPDDVGQFLEAAFAELGQTHAGLWRGTQPASGEFEFRRLERDTDTSSQSDDDGDEWTTNWRIF